MLSYKKNWLFTCVSVKYSSLFCNMHTNLIYALYWRHFLGDLTRFSISVICEIQVCSTKVIILSFTQFECNLHIYVWERQKYKNLLSKHFKCITTKNYCSYFSNVFLGRTKVTNNDMLENSCEESQSCPYRCMSARFLCKLDACMFYRYNKLFIFPIS